MKHWFAGLVFACLIVPAEAGWQSRDSNYNTVFVSGGGGGPTCASVLPGLLVNLDASNSASVVRSGSNVTAWNDLSGNGYNFTATNSPQYSATGFPGSLPGITFASASSTIAQTGTGAVALNSAPLSVFVVYDHTNAAAGNSGIVSIVGPGSTTDFNTPKDLSISQNGNGTRFSSDQNTLNFDNTTGGIVTGVAQAMGITFDGANGQVYSNFSAGFLGAKTGAFGNTTATIVLGARILSGLGSPAVFHDGVLSEVIITTSTISGAALTTLHSCISAKWGTP
jgi:hypothetical protein